MIAKILENRFNTAVDLQHNKELNTDNDSIRKI
jgi:hypothetical protein